MLGAEVVRSVQDGQPRVDLKLGGADIFIAPVPRGDATVGAPPRQGPAGAEGLDPALGWPDREGFRRRAEPPLAPAGR